MENDPLLGLVNHEAEKASLKGVYTTHQATGSTALLTIHFKEPTVGRSNDTPVQENSNTLTF